MAFKYGIVEWAFPFPGPYGLKIAADLGLQGIELDFGEYEDGYPLSDPVIRRAYMECGKEYGIEFPAIALNALNTHGMSHGRDTVDGMIAVETIYRGVETAIEMDIPVIQMPSFDSGDIRSDEDFYNTCEKLRLACAITEGTGLIIALENVLDAEKTKQMLKEVGSDRLKVFFDTQNYYLDRGYNEPELLEAIADDVAMVHVKDGFNHTISSAILGTGDVSFAETAEVIKRTKCTEWLFLENYYGKRPLLNQGNRFDLLKKDIEALHAFFDE